jgi:hypothetical protein
MKKVILSLCFVIIGLSVFSQSLRFSVGSGSHCTLLNYGDTVIVQDSAHFGEIIAGVNVKNTSSNSLNVICRKRYVYNVPGTENYFCWAGGCFQPSTMVSPSAFAMAAGDSTTEFTSHYSPNGNGGITVVRFTFYDSHTTSDSGYFFIKYIGVLGVNDNILAYSISSPYPNPAKDITHIKYNVNVNSKAYIQIYNICGKIEKQVYLTDNNGILDLNVSNLPSGIYFCSLNINGKAVRTNKLIVSH